MEEEDKIELNSNFSNLSLVMMSFDEVPNSKKIIIRTTYNDTVFDDYDFTMEVKQMTKKEFNKLIQELSWTHENDPEFNWKEGYINYAEE